jgi:hypothetical protein
MLAAYVRGSSRIDPKHVRQAWRELEGQGDGRFLQRAGAPRRRTLLVVQGFVLGLAVAVGAAAWLGFYRSKPLELPAGAFSISSEVSKDSPAVNSQDTPVSSEDTPPAGLPTAAPDGAPNHLQPAAAEVAGEVAAGTASATIGRSDSQPHRGSEVGPFAPTSFPGEVLLRALLVEYQRDLQQRRTNAKTALASVSASFGLEMLPIHIDLNRLKLLCVASLVETPAANTSEPTLQIVRGTSAEGIELTDAGGNIRRIPDAEFVKNWHGQVYLFHRGGLELRGVLAPGRQSPQVSTLQQGLSALGYLQGEPSGFFDEATTEAVRRFQRDYSLQVDGTAGPATKIVLYHLIGRSLSEARNE